VRIVSEKCDFVVAAGRRVHYRRYGAGPPMIMMHASPLSSKSVRGAMQVFGRHFTCFALDNPGFGLSEPLPIGQGDMAALADALKDTIEALELEHPVVYGASTGAAIAHAFGCKYPTAPALCMLDTFSHYDTDDTLEGYFPDVIPRRDGGHLLASWEKISGLYLFSPWQKAEPSRRQVRDFPEPAMLHDMVLQLLCAGTDYKQLYAAAIAWEDAANVDRLSAPATLNVWESASGLTRVQMLIDRGLPENYVPIYSDAAGGRYANQLNYLVEQGFCNAPPVPAHTTVVSAGEDYGPLYIETSQGTLFAKAANGMGCRPIVFLHDWGGSAEVFQSIATALATRHPVLAMDLPSHGDSPMQAGSVDELVPRTVTAVGEAISQLGFEGVDVIGIGAGLLLGNRLKESFPALVNRVVCLATAPVITELSEFEALTEAALSFEPDISGAHLIRAFSVARQQDLFWTWWRRTKATTLARTEPLDPVRIHGRAIDLLKSGNAYSEFHRATYSINGEAETSLCLVPNWLSGNGPVSDQLPEWLRKEICPLPDDGAKWGQSISAALAN